MTSSPTQTQAELREAPDEADADEVEYGPVQRVLLRVASSNYWILLILLAIVVAFAAVKFDQFASPANLRNIATDVSILLIMAVGATFVVIAAGVDLSVGSVLVFSGVVGGKLMEGVGGNGVSVILLGLAGCLASGFAWGLINGLLVAKAQIPPLIATLGTLGMALGLAQVLTDGIDLRDVPPGLSEFGTGRAFDQVPYLVIIAVVITVVGGVVLAWTRFGRHTYAIGSNAEAAQREGIRVVRHTIMIYTLAGLLSGVAGFLSLARFATTTISGHSLDVLQVIAGVVLGGVSLFGGVGFMLGTAIGMLIPAVLQNGFVVAGVQPFWQQVAVGAVLILAVYVDQLRRRFRYQS